MTDKGPSHGVSLRALMSAPDRFEHHLVVVALAGDAVLECTAAGEPLAFAHANISDEYALVLPTGNPLLDSFQARTFVSDDAGRDVARVKHGVDDLVLNPHGFWHWPGRLRAPYPVMDFAPGLRPRGISLVLCAARPCAPGERPLGATPGREADLKADRPDVPLALVDTRKAPAGVVGRVADAVIELVVDPGRLDPPHGGWLVDLETAVLHRLPGDVTGVRRGLYFYSPTAPAADPPPIPEAPFTVFEDGAPGELPWSSGGLSVAAGPDPSVVKVSVPGASAEVPRHWLARLLFRVALHGFRLGRVETYGGFFVDDTGPLLLAGLRGAPPVALAPGTLEALYRAAAPAGYRERPLP